LDRRFRLRRPWQSFARVDRWILDFAGWHDRERGRGLGAVAIHGSHSFEVGN
jgi:hypothetical protein